MRVYQEKRLLPVKIEIKGKPQEVRFKLVSCMCDNRYSMLFKKNSDGSYQVSAGQFSLSNFQMRGDYDNDLRWLASQGKWKEVADIIKSGTSTIEDVSFLPDYNEKNDTTDLSFKERIDSLFDEIKESMTKKMINRSNKARGRNSVGIKRHNIFIDDSKMAKLIISRGRKLSLVDDKKQEYSIRNLSIVELAKIEETI